MSRLVDGLVEKRLLSRKPCDEDRRHVRLSLTAKGQATLSEARELAQFALNCESGSEILARSQALAQRIAPSLFENQS